MSLKPQSDIFGWNLYFWKIFCIWPERTKPSQVYKYFSWFYLFVNLFIYNILLTLNLIYTPRSIEFLIREVIFYFNEIAVTSKVLMVVIMRDNIIEAFDLLDSEQLETDDDFSKEIIQRTKNTYNAIYKCNAIISNMAYSSQVFIPIILYFILNVQLELPICKYYFLTDDLRDRYFVFWFIYQSFGMYGHMMYNVNIDSFIAGLLFISIKHCKIIERKLLDLQSSDAENKLCFDDLDKVQMNKLRRILIRYDTWLKYITVTQKIFNVAIFVQYSMASLIICVVLCGLLLPSSAETFVFMVMYLFIMILEIIVPSYLGTEIKYASQDLVFAAYNTEWIPRSESFKRSIKVFVTRANIPIEVTGLNMFPLSLTTFTSIMKSAYSFFTLLRSFDY